MAGMDMLIKLLFHIKLLLKWPCLIGIGDIPISGGSPARDLPAHLKKGGFMKKNAVIAIVVFSLIVGSIAAFACSDADKGPKDPNAPTTTAPAPEKPAPAKTAPEAPAPTVPGSGR